MVCKKPDFVNIDHLMYCIRFLLINTFVEMDQNVKINLNCVDSCLLVYICEACAFT